MQPRPNRQQHPTWSRLPNTQDGTDGRQCHRTSADASARARDPRLRTQGHGRLRGCVQRAERCRKPHVQRQCHATRCTDVSGQPGRGTVAARVSVGSCGYHRSKGGATGEPRDVVDRSTREATGTYNAATSSARATRTTTRAPICGPKRAAPTLSLPTGVACMQDEQRAVAAAKTAAEAEVAKLQNKLQVRQFSSKKKARESRQVRQTPHRWRLWRFCDRQSMRSPLTPCTCRLLPAKARS